MRDGRTLRGHEPDPPKSDEPILQFFVSDHLAEPLRAISAPFAALAKTIMELPRNPERTVALRKLLEAKDAAVRAKLARV
jgi:hypothetical protein